MDLSTFEVRQVVVHDVPLPGDPTSLVLTDAPVSLDQQLREYFRDKVVGSLGASGLDIVADSTADSTARDNARQIAADGRPALVSCSQRLAEHLYAIQSGRNSAGLLAVILGSIEGSACVAILKLEREQGVHVEIRTERGRQVIDLEFLRDLTLTDKTRVFKTALVAFRDRSRAESLFGFASDDQRSRAQAATVAEFFLHTFLGCELAVNPERTTLAFTEAAQRFITEDVASPQKQARYQVALMARLEDEALDLNPQAFAARSLDQTDRSKFLRRVKDAGLDPERPFQKNLDLVSLRGFRIVFEHGMILIGGRDDLEERVRTPATNSPRGGTEIHDPIRRFQGR
jgi:hypothetical protein